MGSRKTYDGAEKVYEAAALWVDRALRTDDSLFTPGVAIWSSRWLRELRDRFLDRPDEGGDSFLEKLERQLDGSPPEVYQLMGEALYFYFLIVFTKNSHSEREVIETVLGWSPTPVAIPSDLVAGLTPGIAFPGIAFHTYRPFQVGFLIEFAEQFKDQEPSGRQLLLDDPWAFKDFVMGVQCRSMLLRNYQNTPRAQREALLHLVYPNTFEGTVTAWQKEEFANAKAFAHFIAEDTSDVDRRLAQIRQGLEGELGRDFDFYDPDIGARLDNKKLWDDFVKKAQAYVATGKLEIEEIDYKVQISRKLEEARAAVLGGGDDWAPTLKNALNPNQANFISWRLISDLNAWCAGQSDEALKALKAIWAQDESSVPKRIRAFSDQLPREVSSGTGSRMNVASVLLMALDVEQYPPFRIRLFEKAYELTGYGQAPKDSDEAALYEHALGFLDRFIDEATERGLSLRHRLDAQSVVWAVAQDSEGGQSREGGQESNLGGKEPENEEPPRFAPDLPALAEETFLPVEFLEEIDTLLKDKRQVIFQGPPGTGKTLVAQKLANCLAGSKERVTLVQFHPSYAYEDFVQGFRPVQTGNGQAGFDLRDGPLLRAADRAKNEPNADHFLVIDEINRGNLAKVFGELYFLLEYRDEEISLQYQQGDEDKFSMPDNLYIIGTMNTADRSIALVDLALRRRFYFVEFHPDDEPVKSVLQMWLSDKTRGMEWLADIVKIVNVKLEDHRHAAIGPSYFMKEGLDKKGVERVWQHSVIPYIEECLFGDNDRINEFGLEKLLAAASGDADPESDSVSASPADSMTNDA